MKCHIILAIYVLCQVTATFGWSANVFGCNTVTNSSYHIDMMGVNRYLNTIVNLVVILVSYGLVIARLVVDKRAAITTIPYPQICAIEEARTRQHITTLIIANRYHHSCHRHRYGHHHRETCWRERQH